MSTTDDSALLALAKADKIMFVCKECAQNNPEGCGHFDAASLRESPSGDWICEGCYDEARENEDDPWWVDLPHILVASDTHSADAGVREAFQSRVAPWMGKTFGPEISADVVERCDRFIEEALELIQAHGHSQDRAHALVDYVYGRPQGDINQEVGGVMVTLAALCLATGVDMHGAGETELERIWTKIDQIRAKQAAKPKGSALPVATPAQSPADTTEGLDDLERLEGDLEDRSHG